MMFDVCIIIGKNEKGKNRFIFRRVRDVQLGEFLRKAQDRGGYIYNARKLVPIQGKEDWIPIDTEKETLDDVMEHNQKVMKENDKD